MKKETKRYTLVEYLGSKERYYDSKEEYENVLREIEKSNKRKTSRLYCGNITTERLGGGRLKATIHIYGKLTEPMTITELDTFTLGKTEEELISELQDKIRTKDCAPDINIAYFENKNQGEKERVHYDRRIKYIPVMYKGDEKYLDKDYISNCFKFHANQNDYGFFLGIANEFCFYRVVDAEIEALYIAVDRCRNQGYNPYDMYIAAMRLFRNLIIERDKDQRPVRDARGEYQTSRRRLRDFATYIRDYNMPEKRKASPVKYNGRIKPVAPVAPVVQEQQPEEKEMSMQLSLFDYKNFQ